MLFARVYAVVCCLSGLRLPPAAADRASAIELLALRHEVRVLRRQVKRPRWRPADQLVLAAPSRCVP